MSEYCFFTTEASALAETAGLKETLTKYAEDNKKQLYILCRPLSKESSVYDYQEAFVIFASGMKPCFIDISNNPVDFDDFIDEFIDDISHLSKTFEYNNKIGKKKTWVELLEITSSVDFDFDKLQLTNPRDKRIADLITSLVIGSINDISKINLDAANLLDTIKSKIILFDTDQTSFVFNNSKKKKFAIQGLAGSGKTELLLHKLKEVYSNEEEARIAFTCYNRILASSMRNRIPEFFNFMKIQRQIDWDNKLFCFHSWGNRRNPNSGMYRYICHKYEIPFGSLQNGSFDTLCKTAVEDIKKQGNQKFIFDYIFIDESQDFSEHFIELCELVTEKEVFVAGDVFQNIFRPINESVSHADLVLKKCYRTDPKNLMFSHALGMGLYENPVLRWLQDNEWQACGYNYIAQQNRATVYRDSLRRFEDIPNTFQSTSIHLVREESISDSIFSIVEEIIQRHPTVTPGDIAVLFLDKSNYIYNEISTLARTVSEKLSWDVNISHESKTSDSSKFFISNINNAKGLEFPFVICFAQNLNSNPAFRNGLYTMMARSFLESHLVLGKHTDTTLLDTLRAGLDCINTNNYMDLRIPSPEEIENQNRMLEWNEEPSLEEMVIDFCEKKGATPRLKAKLIQRMAEVMGDLEYEEEYFNSLINAEYKRYETL